jgi:predicted tellurium resistance membrane protein TerC
MIMVDQILDILKTLDFTFSWNVLLPGLIVTALELCLSADNVGALTEMVSHHNEKDQKWLVKNQLLTGTLINIPMIIFVMVAKQFEFIENPLELILGSLLGYVFVKQSWEIMTKTHSKPCDLETTSDQLLVTALTEPQAEIVTNLKTEVLREHEVVVLTEPQVEVICEIPAEIPLLELKMKLWILVGLNLQSMPFLIDSVPLAATVTSNIIAITIGILLNRMILVLVSDKVVDFFHKNISVLWGVMVFIGLSAIHAIAFSVLEWFHYELFEFNIPGELSLLAVSIVTGMLSYDFVYSFVQTRFVTHEPLENQKAEALKA